MPATVITLKALQGGERTREEDVLRVLGKCWIFGCLQGQVLELPGKDLALIFLSLKKKKAQNSGKCSEFCLEQEDTSHLQGTPAHSSPEAHGVDGVGG